MYSTIEDVKVTRLRMDPNDTSVDSEITHFIAQADSMIDEVHKRLGIATPVSNPSERLKKLSADVAATLYMIWNSREIGVREALWREIKEMIAAYERDLARSGVSSGASLTVANLDR